MKKEFNASEYALEYRLKNYKRWSTDLKPEVYKEIEELKEKLNLSRPQLLEKLVNHYKKSNK